MTQIYPQGMGRIENTIEPEGEIRRTVVSWAPILPKLIVERLDMDAVIPTYATEGDSGMDLYAIEDRLIYPQDTELIPTGLRFQIPRHPFHELGYRWEMQVRPRSSVSANTKLVVANAPGTVDNFYTDEVKVIMRNTSEVPMRLDVEKDFVESDARSLENMDVDLVLANVDHVLDLKGHTVPWASLPTSVKGGPAGWEGFPLGTYLIRRGERIAQIVFNQVIRPLEIVEGVVNATTSRGGGFGSSGV